MKIDDLSPKQLDKLSGEGQPSFDIVPPKRTVNADALGWFFACVVMVVFAYIYKAEIKDWFKAVDSLSQPSTYQEDKGKIERVVKSQMGIQGQSATINEFGGWTLKGYVVNQSQHKAETVTVVFTLYDKKGNQLDTTSTLIWNVPAGEKKYFEHYHTAPDGAKSFQLAIDSVSVELG